VVFEPQDVIALLLVDGRCGLRATLHEYWHFGEGFFALWFEKLCHCPGFDENSRVPTRTSHSGYSCTICVIGGGPERLSAGVQ